MGIEVMGKWEWECSVGMRMGRNGNGNDSMGVGREWEQESHSRTPLVSSKKCRWKGEGGKGRVGKGR